MYDQENLTDHPAHPPARVRFGDGDSQDMPLLWAENGLRWLYEHRRQAFADMMLAVMETGFTTGRAVKNGSNGGHR